jgi:hypothetical protein
LSYNIFFPFREVDFVSNENDGNNFLLLVVADVLQPDVLNSGKSSGVSDVIHQDDDVDFIKDNFVFTERVLVCGEKQSNKKRRKGKERITMEKEKKRMYVCMREEEEYLAAKQCR